jgi:hypothetical protein
VTIVGYEVRGYRHQAGSLMAETAGDGAPTVR